MATLCKSLNKEDTIAIVGLGYVGLQLAIEFGDTYGFDLSMDKVKAFITIRTLLVISTEDLKKLRIYNITMIQLY